MWSYRKVGGIRFWKLGRIGGSFYVTTSRRKVTVMVSDDVSFDRGQWMDRLCAALAWSGTFAAFYYAGLMYALLR